MKPTPIKLGEGVDLHPADFMANNVLAYGGPGAGKTTIMRLICERAPADFQQVLIDNEDELGTLRGDGRDYIILGGQDADAPGLEEMDWRELAGVVIRTGANFIFQINDWPMVQQRRFIGELVRGFLQTPRDQWRPLLFCLDESDQYCPNGPTVESSEALVMLAKRGRKRGWSCMFATQRMSLLSADLRGMCSSAAVGLANQMLDQKAAAQALGFSPTGVEARGLKSLKRGEFWVYGPAFGGGAPHLAHFERSRSSAPQPGAAPPPSTKSKSIMKALAAIVKPPPPPPAPATAEGEPAGEVVKVIDEAATAAAIEEATKNATRKAWTVAAVRLRRLADALEARADDVDIAAPIVDTKPAKVDTKPRKMRTDAQPVNGHDRVPATKRRKVGDFKGEILAILKWMARVNLPPPSRSNLAEYFRLLPTHREFSKALLDLYGEGAVRFIAPDQVEVDPSHAEPGGLSNSERLQAIRSFLSGHQRAAFDVLLSGGAMPRAQVVQAIGLVKGGKAYHHVHQLEALGLIADDGSKRVRVRPGLIGNA